MLETAAVCNVTMFPIADISILSFEIILQYFPLQYADEANIQDQKHSKMCFHYPCQPFYIIRAVCYYSCCGELPRVPQCLFIIKFDLSTLKNNFFEQSDKVNHRWPLADKTVTDVTLKTKQLRLLIIRPL